MKNFLIFTGGGLLLWYGLWFAPEWTQYQTLKAQEIQEQKQTSQRHDFFVEIDQFDPQKKAVLSEALLQVPLLNQQESLIRDLKNISQQSGFSFQSLGFTRGFNSQVNAQTLSVSFEVKGPEDRLLKFLERIEQNQRFLSMDTITLSPDKTDKQVRLSLTIVALYLKPEFNS